MTPPISKAQAAAHGLHAPGHVLIQFKPGASEWLETVPEAQALEALLARLGLPPGARLEESTVAKWIRSQREANHARAQTKPVDLSRFFYLHLPPGMNAVQCVARLQHHPAVAYVELDGIGFGSGTIPNDPRFSSQWHHRNLTTLGADIHTPAAWDITTGSSNVLVAVLDTGLNTELVEFQGRLVQGYDFVNKDSVPMDDHGHGTGVAGTLCANANNAALVAGVDWHCRLMPIKVLDARNVGLYSWWADGIDFALSNGCRIINLSAGGATTSVTLRRAISNAVAQGAVFVTITHNDGTNTIRFPGNLPESITVGATDDQDRRAAFSNFGPQIDLVAPGDDIATVSKTGSLAVWWGTSFAAPQVSGVCALLASLYPDLNQADARNFLIGGADDQVGGPTDLPGFDVYHGHGRLNAFESVRLAHASQPETGQGYLRVLRYPNQSAGVHLRFLAFSNRTYSVLFRDDLNTGGWLALTHVHEAPTNRVVSVWDTAPDTAQRFYRLMTPSLPD